MPDPAQDVELGGVVEISDGLVDRTHPTPVPAGNAGGVLAGQLDLFTGEEVLLTTPAASHSNPGHSGVAS